MIVRPRLYYCLGLVGLALAFASGCQGSTKSTKTQGKPAASVISISYPPGAAVKILQQFGPLFQESTNTVLQSTPRAADASPDPAADLWVIEPAEMPFWAAADKLLPVPDEITEPAGAFAWERLLPLYKTKLLVWKKKAYALPMAGDPLVCFYRKDLLADATNQADFKAKYGRELSPPTTWQQFVRIAEFFNQRPRPRLDRPCPSLTALPRDDDGLDRAFYLVAAQTARLAVDEAELRTRSADSVFSFHYDLNSGEPRLREPGFAAALDLLKRLQTFRAAPSDVPEKAFADGESVMCITKPAWGVRFQASPPVQGKFAILNLPGSEVVYDGPDGQARLVINGNFVPYLGAEGLVMVVPSSSKQPDKAFRLAAFLGSAKTSRDVVIEPDAGGAGVFRGSHLEAGVGWQAFELGARQEESLVQILRGNFVHTQLANPLLRLRIPDQAAHRALVLREVRAALFAGKDAARAMQDADQAWRDLDRGRSKEERMLDYRLSLNLGVE
jgi:multiple sugar transport system substrate-binding protein